MASDSQGRARFGPRASHLNDLWGALIVEELTRNKVGVFCLSPGSRCTPLTLAVARHAGAASVIHFDERGTAYHALGWARATRRPAALICTSGTAVANYLPAVVEASAAGVPLILLSADRPPELLDTGANQAIDQTKIFGGYVRWCVTLPCPDEAVAPEVILTTIDQAVYRAIRSPAGPVHVNCMFREPLAPAETARNFDAYLAGIAPWELTGAPYTTYAGPARAPAPEQLDHVLGSLAGVRRGLMIIGQLEDVRDTEAALRLADAASWPVFADITSGLRLGISDTRVVPYYDLLLLWPRFQEWCRPEAVLHVGGPFTSKRLLEHLAAHPPARYFLATDHPRRSDPAHRVTTRIEADIGPFCEEIMSAWKEGHYNAADTAWLDRLRRCSAIAHETVEVFQTRHGALSEIAVARLLSENVPEDAILFLGNSMPVRDMDTYASPAGKPVIAAANRGASGIDGTIATAAGYARGRPSSQSVTVLLGDMAMLHDLNSLALIRKTPVPVIVVVVNNNGGGIFSFLPVAAAEPHFERFFAAPHDLHFQHAAELFGLDYYNPETLGSFVSAYREAATNARSAIIEVNTERNENIRVHRALDAAVVAALEKRTKS
jgi:2-succinyl-5-enolpyruvyl-6-hydroxy-3-cyclohexene-1-carboxylate synthase